MTEKPPDRRPHIPLSLRIGWAIVKTLGGLAHRSDGTVNRRLLSLLDFKSPPNPIPVDGVSTFDYDFDPARNLKVRLFSPAAGDSPLPVVVYFHGGGFISGSAFSRTFDTICRRLARRIPAAVLSVEYRLAPEHRYPAAYDDGEAVLRWLDSGCLPLPAADLSSVFLAGDSAGGNIAHHVARRYTTSSFENLSIAGVIGNQPFFGGEDDTESEKRLEGVPFGCRGSYKSCWRSFLPVGSSLDHEAANVFGPGSGSGSEDWAGFPPTMVVIGGMDTLQDRERWYADGLRAAGVDVRVVEYPDAFHGFVCMPNSPESEQYLDEVADFVQWVLRKRSAPASGDQLPH